MARNALQRLPFGRGKPAIDQTAAARYASAMHSVRTLSDDLSAAQLRGASAAERRRLHAGIDEELARAVAAAKAVYDRLFEAAGGRHHGDTDAGVGLWKRRLNTALTIRSQHQLAEFDDAGVLPPQTVRLDDRAAFGPHQAGLDFDIDPAS